MKKFFFFILTISALACSDKGGDIKRTPVLEVEGKFLYQDEIDQIIPATASLIDSADIAERYIKKWVTDVLVYENAKRNINKLNDIEKRVEEYRKSLIINEYEQALIKERLSGVVTEDEMKKFYETYKSQLISQENLIKGLLLIVPKNAPQIDKVREWVRLSNTKSLENIEKYSLKNAISYDYFMNNWTSFGEILKKAPFRIEDSGVFVRSTSFAETSDSTKMYLLRIVSSIPTGQTEPYDLAKKKISSILLNKKKSDFIIQFENDIYKDAKEEGSINYFKK
ncbi:MAG TPA: peptidylprolyl isomerase [Paludibacteraceae bacterium]|jgi:hypothetical protein|nr:peptidylprolyl isomerase [Paludibacteraceae bacterium]HPS10311.1 peptidylprolyl isomerase [Paludibacteraceae bacterium]